MSASPLHRLLADPLLFTRASGVTLRPYQAEIVHAILDSVLNHRGLTFTISISRQGGKNEAEAHLQAYLLTLLQFTDATIVMPSPTFKPQTENAMRRLTRVLTKNPLTRGKWKKESGYIYRVGSARVIFFSAEPEAHVVGATADTLIMTDEAQDVLTAKYDKDFAPMAASTNATQCFFGTVWTKQTLLARETEAALRAQTLDGRRRVFHIPCDEVSKHVPAYADHVRSQIAKLGRQHPIIRSQYFLETVDADGGMFPAARRALMLGDHPAQTDPTPNRIYALLIDVAGEDEGATNKPGQLANPRRDSTALTVVEIDPATAADPVLRAPTYRAVFRQTWIGVKHVALYGQLLAAAKHWRARYVVIDATGIGAGLAAFLANALPDKVIPYEFNSVTKSQLGWQFLSVIETGRWKDYNASGITPNPQLPTPNLKFEVGSLDFQFENQLAHCLYNIRPGPNQIMQWGVPDGTRDTATGELIHDDLILSAALCAPLDTLDWHFSSPTTIIPGKNPLDAMRDF